MIIDTSFYEGIDILSISKALLGKKLCSDIDGKFCSGYIVETEAYIAPEDKASHAYRNKLTPRTKTMFSGPGTVYIYIIYGRYHLLNFITGPEGLPHCILIRAIEPIDGIQYMKERRGVGIQGKNLTNGPGKFTIAMGIHKNYDGSSLVEKGGIWVEKGLPESSVQGILTGPRVGMSTAEEASNLPYRFRLLGNKWTSKPDKVWYEGW